jgi:hypothetical protein
MSKSSAKTAIIRNPRVREKESERRRDREESER